MFRGYTLKINNSIVSQKIMQVGSYSCTKERVVAGSWRDANGDMHYSYFPNKKAKISFTIQSRPASMQSDVLPIFSQLDNVSVEYYNDLTESYETGVFKIDDPVFKHAYNRDGLMFYAATQVTLTEN